MADHHDDVDAWLSERVDPLPPPPGTFELIRRRARQRKYRRLAITASAAAVIVAAAVTVPQVVNLPVLSPAGTSRVTAGRGPSATPDGAGRTESAAATSPPSAAGSAAPVPPDFRPTSVTFVGTETGWVIGQAGVAGACATEFCTSVARTDNAGKTWTGIPAPLAGPPDGATGVSQVRFLNTEDGWAFGPELFATTNGGKDWTAVGTGGLRVTDLETVGDRVFALFASCTGGGSAFAGACTHFTLYSASATASSAAADWTPVGATTSGLTSGAPDEAASVVLTGSRGFLLAPDRALYAGPVNGGGAWKLVNSITPACPVGAAQADGQPAGALLGAVSAKELILACAAVGSSGESGGSSGSGGSGASGDSGGSGGSGGQEKLVFSSPNGGASWIQIATAPTTGIATSVAASPAEAVVLGTDQGIDVLPQGDIAWQQAHLTGPLPAGGFGYVGMTTDEQGIALPADPASGAVWFTFDGGRSWQPSVINGS
jgi:hypothetical protein